MGRLTATLANLALALASALALAQPPAAFPTVAVDQWLDALHAAHGFSGAVVIAREGDVVYARGAGLANAEQRLAFTPETRTDSGSLAKPFTAAALLMLVDAGLVDLDAPVSRYVNEYPDATTKVYDLLSHRAPLPDYDAFGDLFRAGKPVTTTAMLEQTGRMPAPAPYLAAPRFTYCNLCLDTAALVVEGVTGKPFEAWLREQILRPAGVERAFIRPARLAAMPSDRAVGYRFRGGKRELFDAEEHEAFFGGGNLYASARDFARFARAFAGPGKAFALPRRALWPLVPHGDLISVLTLGNWYCTRAADRCYYTGAHRGFYNVMYFDRAKRLVVVYVSNSAIAPWLQPRITQELVVVAEGRLPAPPIEPKLVALTPEVLRGAAGTYDVPGAGHVTLFDADGKPYVRAGGAGVEYRLYRVSSTVLYAPGLDAFIGFGSDGRMSWATGFIDSYGIRVRP